MSKKSKSPAPESVERRCLVDPQSLSCIRAEGKMPSLSGLVVPYGKPSDAGGYFTEEFLPGAFSDCLARNDDVCALLDHDSRWIIGRRSAKTLSLSEDETGLKCVIDLPETSYGKDAVVSIDRGDLRGMSVGFITVEDRWSTRDGKQYREVVKADIFDASIVAWPFYADTSVALRRMPTPSDPIIEQPADEDEDRLRIARIRAGA